MSGLSAFAKVLLGLTGLAVILGVAWLLPIGALEWYKSKVCFTEVLGNISGVSGLDFEISETDCWHNPEASVFVSKAGGRRKTLLIAYVPSVVPTITSVDERTIQIALGDVDHVFCRKDRWEGMTIRYDIRGVRNPGNRAELQEC